MKEEIKVSIICNVFNHEKYIRDALEGFVSQKTSFLFEVLIHDDASTDRSADIIHEYEVNYPDLIKPIYQTQNQYSRGGGITRRFQTPRARGKYIAICEGDDYWTDQYKLQKQYDFLENNPEYSMCTCSAVWLDMRTMKQENLCATATDRDVELEEIILEPNGRVFQYASIFARCEVFRTLPEWTRKFRVGDLPLEMYAATCGKIRMLADSMVVYRNHVRGSWTERIDKNVQYKTKMFTATIDGMNAFNEATGYRYDEIVSRRINKQEYLIARINGDLSALRTGDLRNIYMSKSFIGRLSDVLMCKVPRLHACLKILILKVRR